MGGIHNLIRLVELCMSIEIGNTYKINTNSSGVNTNTGEYIGLNHGDTFIIISEAKGYNNKFIVEYLGSREPDVGKHFRVIDRFVNKYCERLESKPPKPNGCACSSFDLLHCGHIPGCSKE